MYIEDPKLVPKHKGSKIQNLKWLFLSALLAACNSGASDQPGSPLASPAGGASILAFEGKDMLVITGGILAVMLAVVGFTVWRRP